LERGIIAEEFTCRNTAVIAQAITNFIKEEHKKNFCRDLCLKILQKLQRNFWMGTVGE
jgi:hypothetical protein